MPGIIAAEKAAGKFTQGRLAEPHRALQRRRDAAGAQLDPPGTGGRDDLAAGDALRAVRGLLREAGGRGREVPRRHEDRPRQQDRDPPRQPRGRDRRPGRDRSRTSTTRRSGGTTSASELDVGDGERAAAAAAARRPRRRRLEVLRADDRRFEDVSAVGARRGVPRARRPQRRRKVDPRRRPDRAAQAGRGAVGSDGKPAPSLGDRAAWQERVACVYQRSMVIPIAQRRRRTSSSTARRRRSCTGGRCGGGRGSCCSSGGSTSTSTSPRRALGGAEADRRDRTRALDRRALPDPRRADRVARVERDRAAVRARAADEGERRRDPLHLPSPRGDLRDLRHA